MAFRSMSLSRNARELPGRRSLVVQFLSLAGMGQAGSTVQKRSRPSETSLAAQSGASVRRVECGAWVCRSTLVGWKKSGVIVGGEEESLMLIGWVDNHVVYPVERRKGEEERGFQSKNCACSDRSVSFRDLGDARKVDHEGDSASERSEEDRYCVMSVEMCLPEELRRLIRRQYCTDN